MINKLIVALIAGYMLSGCSIAPPPPPPRPQGEYRPINKVVISPLEAIQNRKKP